MEFFSSLKRFLSIEKENIIMCTGQLNSGYTYNGVFDETGIAFYFVLGERTKKVNEY